MSTVQQKEQRWLSCHLDKGMFSDEVAVTYPHSGPVKKSVFVPRVTVRGNVGETGTVRVVVIRSSGKLMAVLPSSRQDVVVVTEDDVSE